MKIPASLPGETRFQKVHRVAAMLRTQMEIHALDCLYRKADRTEREVRAMQYLITAD